MTAGSLKKRKKCFKRYFFPADCYAAAFSFRPSRPQLAAGKVNLEYDDDGDGGDGDGDGDGDDVGNDGDGDNVHN